MCPLYSKSRGLSTELASSMPFAYRKVKIFESIIPPLRHFTILGQKNAQNMPRYHTVEAGTADGGGGGGGGGWGGGGGGGVVGL